MAKMEMELFTETESSLLEAQALIAEAEAIAAEAVTVAAPPPRLKISEWADHERHLSAESSAEPGRWRTDRAPYQRGVMDALNDPLISSVVFIKSAQVGATEIINNIAGYYMSQDPAPILAVFPTLTLGQAWSKDRLAPMLRDTPCLTGIIADRRSRDSENTVLHKKFKGGQITISGANSPASLASRPIRILLLDEIDRYPLSAGAEGDPSALAEKRTKTFWNRKIFRASTPTIKGFSAIEAQWEISDQRRFFVPCPHCGNYDHFKWANIKWDKDEDGSHQPDTAFCVCENCGGIITDADKHAMLAAGEWRATAPYQGVAGFHINEIYSPWTLFSELVLSFLKAKKLGAEAMRVWVNTALGETFEEDGARVSGNALAARREDYSAPVPLAAAVLTAGVDVQDDRLECEVVGWGEGEESWNIDYKVFYGDPATADVWNDLDEYLQRTWEHESGAKLKISATGIDTGGHHTKTVYEFVRPRWFRRVFALKGSSTTGAPAVTVPKAKSKTRKVRLFTVGTDTLKSLLYSRFKLDECGPGYCHFPLARDDEYFDQITAEKIVTKYVRGYRKRIWEKIRPRNEALDCRIYAHAALLILNPDLKKRAASLAKRASANDETAAEVKEDTQKTGTKKPKRRTRRKIKKGFARSW